MVMKKTEVASSWYLLLLSTSVFISQGDAQLGDVQCDVTVRIPHMLFTPQRIAVEREPSDVVCLVCLDPSGGTDPSTNFGLPTGNTLGPNEAEPDVGINVNGTLQLVPGAILDGINGFDLFFCSVGENFTTDITLYSTTLVAEINNPSPASEMESAAVLLCSNLSPPEVSAGVEWFRQGQSEVLTTESSIFFNPPRRENAGVYTCRVVSLISNETLIINTTFVVEYLPEVTFSAPPSMMLPLGSELTLTCDYSAVPAPAVKWLINNTVPLDPSDTKITVDTGSARSTLTITGLELSNEGNYSCNVTNSQGSVVRTLTSVIILTTTPPLTRIEFQQSIYQVTEDVGLNNLALRICLNVSNLNSARNVTISTSPGTAEAGSDYEEIEKMVTLTARDTRKCVAIIVLEDEMIEADESFYVHLNGFESRALVIILDDDGLPSSSFTGNTPLVLNNQVTFNLLFGRSVVEAKCAVLQKQRVLEEVDCLSGVAVFNNLPSRFTHLTPRIALLGRNGERSVVTNTERNFRIAIGSRRRCSVHLINLGLTDIPVSETQREVTLEWALSGPTDAEIPEQYMCSLDGQPSFPCSPPHSFMTDEDSHYLFVRPPFGTPGCIRSIPNIFTIPAQEN